MKYKCKSCGDEKDSLSLGDIRIGCANCGSKEGFADHDKPEYDDLMKHLM